MMAIAGPGELLPRVFACALDADDHALFADADALAMSRLARGEVDALGELYDRHQAAVRRFATRMTQSSDDGDDLVHATFLAAMKTAGRFDPARSCRTWLLGITARLVQRERSTFARWTRLLVGFRAPEPAWSRDPESAFGERQGLERGLSRLSAAKRSVLLMAEVEGMSGDEIAAALAIPVGTVWTRLHHARRELLTALGAEDER
jgi:RNA polymerase sigma-70 factor (ECF subfamily)